MIVDEETYLQHFGVKGMHWGVRKERETSEKAPRSKKQKAAIILGTTAAVAAIAAGGIFAKQHFGGSVKNLPKPDPSVKKFAEAMAHEPVGMMHSSRGHGRGYAFLRNGSLKDPEKEFLDAGMQFADDGFFKRYGKNSEKLAVRFPDPLGRKDVSGRPIGHDVIFPPSMAKDIHNMDDAKSTAWPLIKDIFEPFYRSENGTFGPGF